MKTVELISVDRSERQLIQCVPNFSEGIDREVLEKIAFAISECNVRLVDWSADIDHNRSVFTFIGPPAGVRDAALAAAEAAFSNLDISKHVGVHPRLGVLDVLPFVPLSNITLEECALLARETGEVLAETYDVPVFFYDFASPIGTTLPEVRKTAFSTLLPDLGPGSPHGTAGAAAVGARNPLIAFNVNLLSGSLEDAKSIAAKVRQRFFGNVRALGLELKSRGLVQVSMNVIQPENVTLSEIIEFISSFAEVAETELIGALPGFAAFATLQSGLKMRTLRPEQILLENWPTNI